MTAKHKLMCLWNGFTTFYQFSPKRLCVIFVLMLAQSITSGIGLLFIVPLLQLVGFDTGISEHQAITQTANHLFDALSIKPTLTTVLISYILIVSGIATLRLFLTIMSSTVQQAYISHLRSKLYRQLLNARWQFIAQHKMSDFTHCLSGQIQSIGHASHLMLSLASQIVLVSVMITLSFLLSWQMTMLALLFAVFFIIALLPFNQIIYGSGKKQLINYKTIFQMLTEQLSSLKMIKSFARESYYADQMQQISKELEFQQLKLNQINALSQWISALGTVICFSLFFYLSLTLFILPLPAILLLLILYARLLPQITSLQKTWQQLLHKVPAFADVFNLSNQCINAQEPVNTATECPKLKHTIQLKKITYCYPNKTNPVFNGFSCLIKKNQTVALTGASGSGKSTLADLIAGLLKPNSGELYCDDILLTDEQRLVWRQKIAYVTQDIFLFNNTVRSNLSWVANKTLNDNEIWQALSLAAAKDFVIALPHGLDTLIGDRGVRLSGGEKQRLAIARALLAEPQLLILDEATSALDHENEQKIQHALKQLHGRLTIIIIAHRETTIAHADQVIALNTPH